MKCSVFTYLVVTLVVVTGPSDPLAATATGVVFHDENRNGKRDAGESGVPDVRVSNQRDVVITDDKGRYRIPVDDDTTIFVVKPRGWMTPVDPEFKLPRFYYTHKPAGSPATRYDGVSPTGTLPNSVDFPLHRQAEPDTFRMIMFGDPQARNETELEYMARDVINELVGFDADFGITLGDIVFDDLAIFDQHNRTVALIGIPWYNVIGNHDLNFDAPSDKLSDETFERVFGPNYYSFDHGPVHFVVLDDVLWRGVDENKEPRGYVGEFGEQQLQWLESDLRHVPENHLLVLTMHIPMTQCRDREALYRLMEKRPYSLSFSAHTHTQEHVFLREQDGWRGPEPHHHVINVTVCGSWWQGAPDERGIPHATMRDGAPNGYSIVTFDGQKASIDFKAASQPAASQMNIYAPYTVESSQASDTEILVNVFAGSERSKVEMRLGPDGSWAPMQQVTRMDPYKLEIQQAEQSEHPPRGRKMHEPSPTSHMWSAKLPAEPPVGLTLIQVRTTDMFGRTYADWRPIHIK